MPAKKRQWEWVGKWDGGRVRLTSNGTKRWVIERKGKTISLNSSSERDARVQLAAFEANPAEYISHCKQAKLALRTGDTEALRLNAHFVGLFLADIEQLVATEEMSRGHLESTLVPYLEAWAAAENGLLEKTPLRELAQRDLSRIMRGWKTAKQKRYVAIKSFARWARGEGFLERSEDPTTDLKVPKQRKPRRTEERAYEIDLVERVYAAMTNYDFPIGYRPGEKVPKGAPRKTIDLQPLRDLFVLRAMTGLHSTEVERFCAGKGKLREIDGGLIRGTLRVEHKSGADHTVSLTAQAFAAAKRLQASGCPSKKVVSDRVARLHEHHPDLKEFDEFSRLRHTFITHVCELVYPSGGGGVSLSQRAELLGHRSTRMTRTRYSGDQVVPPLSVLPYHLVNVDDPDP